MGERRFIIAGNFIDGGGADLRRNVFLEVEDTIITAIGNAADLSGDESSLIDDFSHCTILPAMVDSSVSLLSSPSVDKVVRLAAEAAGSAERDAILERHLGYCHAYGVLGVAASDDIGPFEGCQQCMTEIRRSGRDFLKIPYTGNIDDNAGSEPRLGFEDLDRILRNRGNKKAVVVANGRQQVGEALEAGCDAIEQGYSMGEDNLRKMAEQGVLWIPGIIRAKNSLDGAIGGGNVFCRFSLGYVAPGKPVPGAAAYWKKTVTEQLDQLRLARKLGVTMAVGTGAGSIGLLHGESMAEEMKLFVKAGYSLEETIRCASENGARFFGMEKLGALAVGRKATFLISRGTPKQLPRKLSYLEGIFVDGAPSPSYRKNPVKSV